MNIKGKIIKVEPIQEFVSGFKKRVFVIETEETYPQKVPFELVKDKVSYVTDIHLNSTVNVHFNVRGNEYQGKYYVSLTAWKVETLNHADQPQTTEFNNPINNTDLPF